MRFRSDLALAAGLALLLALPASGAAQDSYGRRLADAEIRDLAPGVYAGTYKDKLKLVIHLLANGRVTGTANGKPQRGTWRVKDGELCLTFNKTRCGPIFHDGNRYFGMLNKHGKARLMLRSIGEPSI